VTALPPGCTSGCAVASNDGSYPGVRNNDSIDGTFGVTSPILSDQITQSGTAPTASFCSVLGMRVL
jgi:hypothetical protein